MSRTTRKPRWYVEHTDASYINREIARHTRRPYKTVKVRKSDEEYEADFARDLERYREEIAANGGTPYYKRWSCWSKMYIDCEIRRPWANRHRYKRVPYSVDDCIEDAKRERKKLTRDGSMSESGRRTYFKHLAKKEVRYEWKRMKTAILKDEEYDRYCPHDRLGKKHVWSVW